MTLQEIFIDNLKKNRKKRGISQMTLSRMCDTTTNYIGQIEMGRRIPSFEKIEQIASALEIPSYQLFMREAPDIIKEEKPNVKEYLREMPDGIKKEIIAHLADAVDKEIIASFNPQNWGCSKT